VSLPAIKFLRLCEVRIDERYDIAYLLRSLVAGNGSSLPRRNSRNVPKAMLPITIFALMIKDATP
ncbi:MAG: hypothetical protein ACYT04_83450, partial [Nostoc sp.]